MRSDHLLQDTSGADQWNHFKTDCFGPLHRFPLATDRISRPSQRVDRSLKGLSDGEVRVGSHSNCVFCPAAGRQCWIEIGVLNVKGSIPTPFISVLQLLYFSVDRYGVVPEELLTFLGFFYATWSYVPVGHIRKISRHLFTWLVCGSFQWRHGLLFTDCIVWDDKDKVASFKRSHWIHLGWWSTGSSKLQLFQLSQHSHVTNCRLISSSAYFPWNLTLKYKMQLSEGSWDKNPTF